ncbi:TIGR03773 family transporter-associated surface protein [Salinispora pacifica]|uniref:TIGR03773 family transporter-associated surface protein n=1 Tax=Salinispora pacifica TaxID=351187 RepID=UPI00048637CD|nr:TIGR03773 family transporter-associated surface protein [Salinispora pacifica]
MTIRSRCAGAAGLALAVALATGAAPAGAEPPAIGATAADLVSVGLDDDTLSLRVRDAGQVARDAPGYDPAEVVLGPDGGLAGQVPAGPALAFLGAEGQPVWSLSTGDTGFPALDTTGVPLGLVTDDTVTLSLRSVEGPGTFTAYQLSGIEQATALFGSGPNAPRSLRLPAATRTGGVVWAFDAAGDYRLTLSASADLPSGQMVSAEAAYRVRVPAIIPAGQVLPPAAMPMPTPAAGPAAAPPTAAEPRPNVAAKPLAAPTAPAAAAPAAAAPAAAATEARVVVADGHVDMGPQLSGDNWTIRIKDDRTSPAVWRETADVVLWIKDNAKINVPAGADFLGAQGDPVWLLPQSQQPGIVWPGWNTQHQSVVSGVKGNVTWTLQGVDGPGRFALFLTGSFGEAEVLFDSAKSLPQQLAVPLNTHAHGNWAFSKPGLYRLAVQMSGTTTAGEAVADTKTLTIAVGDSTDPTGGFGSGSGSGGDGPDQDGPLPRTGAGWVRLASAVGVLLVVAGALLVLLARRRASLARENS